MAGTTRSVQGWLTIGIGALLLLATAAQAASMQSRFVLAGAT